MKTYPLYNENRVLVGFEITSSWILFRPLFKILQSVDGVTDIKRQWFNDDRISFKFHGHEAIVHEPFGDNSRYWVGLQNPVIRSTIDISPIQKAFNQYNGFTIFYFSPKARPSHSI